MCHRQTDQSSLDVFGQFLAPGCPSSIHSQKQKTHRPWTTIDNAKNCPFLSKAVRRRLKTLFLSVTHEFQPLYSNQYFCD